jgi:hypothetical protein
MILIKTITTTTTTKTTTQTFSNMTRTKLAKKISRQAFRTNIIQILQAIWMIQHEAERKPKYGTVRRFTHICVPTAFKSFIRNCCAYEILSTAPYFTVTP